MIVTLIVAAALLSGVALSVEEATKPITDEHQAEIDAAREAYESLGITEEEKDYEE